jgi:hypothetical protein
MPATWRGYKIAVVERLPPSPADALALREGVYGFLRHLERPLSKDAPH